MVELDDQFVLIHRQTDLFHYNWSTSILATNIFCVLVYVVNFILISW